MHAGAPAAETVHTDHLSKYGMYRFDVSLQSSVREQMLLLPERINRGEEGIEEYKAA